VAAGVVVVSLIAGAVRVLPLLLAPGVPLGLARVLGRGIAGVSLETALFVAPPLGWALAASRLVDRGEARALFAIGVRPLRVIADGWPAALGVALAAGLASAAWGREAVAPGRVVRDLIAEARAACLASPPPAVAEVPLVGLSWICLPGREPLVVGPAPVDPDAGGGFGARAIAVSDDLRSLDASELTLVLPATEKGGGEVRLHAGAASIRGLAPVGRASNLTVPARVVLLSVSAALLAAAAGALTLIAAIGGRVGAMAVGASGPAAALLVFSALERAPSAAAAYGAVPAAGLAALLAAAAIARRVGRTG
jgi:hypothetical protein